ncbi:hypothetical protein CAEBREN_25623 [Caenorhabditis brenneri]|uniref:F-box domain-containing protein n=1 Tax=Caenorhabditis brenneri TaxID=135651 RepID=G0NKV3_CAEBE|nr:hypothetical protein CAEBREN_25623 [Caenorhabditis brenneri]
MVTYRIPILKLPTIVLQMVLQMMRFTDLFLLSRVSITMGILIKILVKIRNHKVKMIFGYHFMFEFISTKDENQTETILLIKNGLTYPNYIHFQLNIGNAINVLSTLTHATQGISVLATSWDDMVSGAYELLKEFFDLFSIEILATDVNLNMVGGNYQPIIRLINWLNPKVPSSRYIGKCDAQAYEWIIRNVESKNKVLFHMHPTEYPEIKWLTLNKKEISITHGKWIDFDQFHTIRGTSIDLRDLSFTDDQLNTIFLGLKGGLYPDLEKLNLQFTRPLNPQAMLNGLDYVLEGASKCSFRMISGKKCVIFYKRFFDVNPILYELEVSISKIIENSTSSY